MQNNIQAYKQNYPQPAMAGFFSWLKRAVKNVGEAVASFLPSPIASAVIDFTNGDGSFYGYHTGNIFGNSFRDFSEDYAIVDIPLTAQEEAVLDTWLNNSFTPFFKPFIEKIQSVKNNPSEVEAVKIYNVTQEFLSYLKWYQVYAENNGQKGFSVNAIKARNQFLKIQAELLKQTLEDFLVTYNLQFFTEVVTLTITKSKYALLDLNTPDVFNIPAKQIVIDDEDINYGNGNELPDTTETAPTTNNASKNSKWIIAVLLGVALYIGTRKRKIKN
jgi:hypothetical protein